jgi:hypothetical protein
MLLATLIAIFFIPLLFVGFERLAMRFGKRTDVVPPELAPGEGP